MGILQHANVLTFSPVSRYLPCVYNFFHSQSKHEHIKYFTWTTNGFNLNRIYKRHFEIEAMKNYREFKIDWCAHSCFIFDYRAKDTFSSSGGSWNVNMLWPLSTYPLPHTRTFFKSNFVFHKHFFIREISSPIFSLKIFYGGLKNVSKRLTKVE